MKDNSHIRILALVVFFGGFIGWSGGAAADWYVSHFAPGQTIGGEPIHRMVVVDDDGLIHLYYAGHALTHAIVDGDDVTFEAITEPGVGYGSLDVTSDPTLGTLISWFDPDRRRRHIVYGETGDWTDYIAQEDLLAYQPQLCTVVDAEAHPFSLVTSRLNAPSTSIYELWTDLFTGSSVVYQEGDWGLGGLTALADGRVVAARTTSGGSFLGEWDGETQNWSAEPALADLLSYGNRTLSRYPMWDQNGEPGIAMAYDTRDYGSAGRYHGCFHIAVAFPETSDNALRPLVADPLWDEMGDMDALAIDMNGFAVIYTGLERLAWINHDLDGGVRLDSAVLNLDPDMGDGVSVVAARVDAAYDGQGRRIAAVVHDSDLWLVRETETGWTRRTVDRSHRVTRGGLWVDSSTTPPVVESLSLNLGADEQIRLDRFDGAWSTRTWPRPVEVDSRFDSQIWAAHDADDWYLLFHYDLWGPWVSGVFRYDGAGDTWENLDLPDVLDSWDVRKMKTGGDGRVWVGGYGAAGYAVATYTDSGWETHSTTDDFPIDVPETGDFTVDANGGIHVVYTLQLGVNLRYAHWDPATGHWTREPIPDPNDVCPLHGRLAIVADPDGDRPVVACFDTHVDASWAVDQGVLTLFVREPSGWVANEIWNDLWTENSVFQEIEGAYDGGYVFGLDRRGEMAILRFDGTDWTSESLPGVAVVRGLRMTTDGDGGVYAVFETPGGVGLVYPSDTGPYMERAWSPGAPEDPVPLNTLDVTMVDPDCDYWWGDDDDTWSDDDFDDDVDDDVDDDSDDDADDDVITSDDDMQPDDDAHDDATSGDDDDDGCGLF